MSDTAPGAKTKRKPYTLLAVVLVVAVAIGTAYMLGVKGKSAPAAASSVPTATTVPPVIAEVDLGVQTINLSAARYLRIGVTVGFQDDTEAKKVTATGPMRDAVGRYFAGRPSEQLLLPEQRQAARDALAKEFTALGHVAIDGVYFTEYTIQ